MKRMISLAAVLIICAVVLYPFAAFADPFVPSIGYKDGPEIEDAEMEEEIVSDCIVVTSILEAEEQTTDIEQEERDLLLEVYEQISEGSMELPLPENYVVRELVDIDFKESECIIPEHPHEEELEQEEVTITVDLGAGIEPGTEVVVLVYRDGEWIPIPSVVNNGDGTLTCVFDYFCPVAFCVSQRSGDGPAQTGDALGGSLYLWTAVLAVSVTGLAAVLVMPVSRRRK